jgi:hypothetical protein
MVKGETRVGRTLAVVALLASATLAQASPGNGIRFGGSSARLHPYLELEGRYDSNVAYDDEQNKSAGWIIHVRPGLILDAPGDQVAVKLDANLDWAQYLGTNSDLSELYGQSLLGVGVNRKGTVGVELTDTFRRTISTSVMSFGSALINNSNVLYVGVPWRPGGGAFVTTVYGNWDLESYSALTSGPLCPQDVPQCNDALLAELGYSDVKGGLELRWRFLPRTAAVLQGEYWKRLPTNSDLSASPTGWRVWAGAQGLVTAHLAATAKVGWGALNDAPGSITSWLANAEAEWLPVETTSVKLGYLHDLGADPGMERGYTTNRGYLEGRALLASQYAAQLRAEYEHRAYTKAGGFTADQLVLEPSADVELARWLRVGAGLTYTNRTSKLPTGAPRLPGFNYNKTEAFVRLRGTY